MATFHIHEDMGSYKPTNKVENNILKPNVVKSKKDVVGTKRLPLRSTSNVVNKPNNQINKKVTTKNNKIENAIETHRGPPKITSIIPKENKIPKKGEKVEEILHEISEPKHDNNYNHENSYGTFLFSQDSLYLTTAEYHDGIYSYLVQLENRLEQPKVKYMDKQAEVTPRMRCILVDWLSSIVEEYNMHPQTFHLAVQYIDCFLSRMSVVRSKFQLVGTAAMMIAAKYEEIYPPDTREWAYLTAETFTPRQLLKMEQLILKVIQFSVARPTAYSFISHVCFVCQLPKKLMLLAMYLSELTLLEGDAYLNYLPSEIASSSVALARHTLQENEIWPKKLESKTGYTLKELSPLIKRQNKTFIESPTRPQQAIPEKFQTTKYGRVSLFRPRVPLEIDVEI